MRSEEGGTMVYHQCVLVFVVSVLTPFVCGQYQNVMDPRVRITDTSPRSNSTLIRGFLAKDVWFNCYVENLPKDLSVRWQRSIRDKDGRVSAIPISQDMAVEDNMKWSIEKPTPYSWRLRIKALEAQDQGNYTCYVELTGNNNRVMDNRTLIVTDKPIILEEFSSSDTTAEEGDYVEMRCNASGIPYPTIMWRREGNAILPGGGTVIMGSEFNIKNVQYDARGRYFCEAYNEVGKDRREIRLRVQYTPRIEAAVARVGQKRGYSRLLACNIEANPVPEIDPFFNQLYWTMGYNLTRPLPVTEDNRRSFRILQGAYGHLTHELIISAVTSSDYGTYYCYARNSMGTAFSSVQLYETSTEEFDKSRLLLSGGKTSCRGSTRLLVVPAIILILAAVR